LLELSQEQILDFLEQYPVKNTDYYNWLWVGMALHHQYKGSEDGFKIWDQWSSKDERYKSEEMKVKWNSFDYDHANPKTFQNIANSINKPSETQEWRQDIEKQINSLSHFSLENDVRKIINILAINCTKNEANIFLYEIKQQTKWLISDLRNMIKSEQKKLQLKKVKEKNPVNNFYSLNTPLPHAIFDGYIDDDKPPKCTYNNFLILLKNYNIKISYNAISKNCDISVPEQKYSKDNEANATFADIISICKLNNIETGCIESYIFKLGDINQYNPVLEFIESKSWDGISRLSDLYNTVKTKLSFPLEIKELLLRKWLISGIAALKHNKFYSKGVLVFQGEQSLGKTPWFKKLLPPEIEKYFKEGCTLDPSNKDSIKTAISHWIVELGELDSTFKKDIARLKAFITSDEDMFRLPYARKDSKFSRRTIFCGSVNEEEFLIDSTGNHRFWVIPVLSLDYTHNIDMQQLWAEVTTIYENNEQWWLTPAEEQKLEVQNQDHFKNSPLEDLLLTPTVVKDSILAIGVTKVYHHGFDN
jgi:putative DNA primase/helicase